MKWALKLNHIWLYCVFIVVMYLAVFVFRGGKSYV